MASEKEREVYIEEYNIRKLKAREVYKKITKPSNAHLQHLYNIIMNGSEDIVNEVKE